MIHVARAASNGLAQLSARPVLDEMVLSQAESRQREVICVERDLCLQSRSGLLSNERKWKNERTEVVVKKGVVWKLCDREVIGDPLSIERKWAKDRT